MKLDVPLKELFDCPVTELRALLTATPSSVWDAAAQRRSQYRDVHSETRAIVFKWLENNWAPKDPPIVKDYDYAPKPLRDHVTAYAATLAGRYGGKVVKLMLTELEPGGTIPQHRDVAPALYMSHRCHLPVITGEAVDFAIDGVTYNLKAGKVYEFDNTRPHAVNNRGIFARVHLICDIMPN